MEDGEEEEEEELASYEIIKPKKRIGRPPKVWSSILLPKEVTSTLGSCKPKITKVQKATKTSNLSDGDGSHSKLSTSNMVGQTVHGVVDGCFDAGFLVSLRMGDSDLLYRGVVFGPGLSIPVAKDTDIAKNVKRRRRKRKLSGGSTEPATPPPPPPPPAREELPSNPSIAQPPPHYEAPPTPHAHHPNNAHPIENPHMSPTMPPSHPHQFAYNGTLHPNNFRSPRPHPEMTVSPFHHSGGFAPRPSVPMPPPQGYSTQYAMPSPSTQYGYNFGGAQARPTTPLPPQYRGPNDPQYRGP